ncbi:hypothetical protein Tco_0896204, partial [Tanacetum coccineum]
TFDKNALADHTRLVAWPWLNYCGDHCSSSNKDMVGRIPFVDGGQGAVAFVFLLFWDYDRLLDHAVYMSGMHPSELREERHSSDFVAAADERKNVVWLAFETMEKIVREYFPYITETETVTFTDCVRCLITFTNSRFNKNPPLAGDDDSSIPVVQEAATADDDEQALMDRDENACYWIPLLSDDMVI